MSVDLSGLPIAEMSIRPQAFGGMVTPPLGGPVQRIERPGSRYTVSITTPPMRWEPDGRIWAAKLLSAKRAGAILPIRVPGFRAGPVGSPVVRTATPSGRTVPIGGSVVGATIRTGQWVSIRHGGRWYLDQVEAGVMVATDGTADLTIQNLLRVPLSVGDIVELTVPKIEGWVSGDIPLEMPRNRLAQFTFEIAEAA